MKTNTEFLMVLLSLLRNNNEQNSYLISLFSLLCLLRHCILKHKRKQTTSDSDLSEPVSVQEEQQVAYINISGFVIKKKQLLTVSESCLNP